MGPLTASALSIALGDGSAFRNGREFAASVGLVPRQHSIGGRTHLLGISKRGDNYLRTLLIYGARSVVHFAPKWDDPLSRWLNQMLLRRHRNVVGVALANKTARTAWAMVRYERDYDSTMMSAAVRLAKSNWASWNSRRIPSRLHDTSQDGEQVRPTPVESDFYKES